MLRFALILALAGLQACAIAPLHQTAPDGWEAVRLPGKSATAYQVDKKEGRTAIQARADRSASLLRRRFNAPRTLAGDVEFSWWVDQLIDTADVAAVDATDSPVRVMFAFDGDATRLSARNQMMFELARTLTGEAPPYATLSYVWDRKHPAGSVVTNPRSDRVRKIVLESGPGNLGRWKSYRRNLRDDFRAAFGEDPGPLIGVMIMTDSDNTASRAVAWYGPIELH